jgi:tetratricopeptide (TPR) repeat protein
MLTLALFLYLRKGIKFSLLITALIVLICIVFPNPLKERISQLQSPADQFERLFLWRVNLANLLDHPFGLGPSMGKYYFSATASSTAPLAETILKKNLDPAHNLVLETGLEGGVVALAGLSALLGYLLIRSIRNRRSFREDPIRLGAGLGLLMLLLHSQVDSLDRSSFLGVLGVMMLALFIEGPVSTGRCGVRPQKIPNPAVRCLGIIFLAAMILLALPWAASEPLRLAAGVSKEMKSENPEKVKWLVAAQKVCPWDYHVYKDLFTLAWDRLKREPTRTNLDKAERLILEAIRLNPLSTDLYRSLGRLYANLPTDLAETMPHRLFLVRRAFRIAENLDPLNIVGRFNGWVKSYIPHDPCTFIRESNALMNLLLPFPLLSFHRGLCYDRIGNATQALLSYQKALKDYERSLESSLTTPAQSLLGSFYRLNITRFRREIVQEKIRSLERVMAFD